MSQFPRFQNLPPELRYEIWRLARRRRYITVRPQRLRPTQSLLWLPFYAPVPPLLHACRESRNFMKTLYHKIFYDASSPPPPPSADGGTRRVAAYTWFDFSYDTVCVSEEHLPLLGLGLYRHLICHVVVTSRFLSDTLFYTSRARCFRHGKALFEFSRLRTAVFIINSTWPERRDRWPIVALGIMIDCYATCRPVPFQLQVIDIARAGLVLGQTSFRFWLEQELDLAKLDIYNLPESRLWDAWNAKDKPGWKHVDCECENVTRETQTCWNFRIKPTWEGGTHFTEFRGLEVLCTL